MSMTVDYKTSAQLFVNQRKHFHTVNDVQAAEKAVYTLSVKDTMRMKLKMISLETRDTDADNAFYVCDIGEVYRQHVRWKTLLPRIEPFYAIKCNTDPMVVKTMASMGIGFDCASKDEIQQVLDLGVDATRIIYANPCKSASYIRYAAQQNVRKMTFDNAAELYKIRKHYPDAELVIRILTDNLKAGSRLGLKFGASLDVVPKLLLLAKELGLRVIGVSFHVGSSCQDEHTYSDAVKLARIAFDMGEEAGYTFTLLDVGGGFPSAHPHKGIPTFEDMAAILGSAVDAAFPPHVRVIAEPGRFFVGSVFTACSQVISVREPQQGQPNSMYYLNDGVYGTFNCVINDPREIEPKVLMKNNVIFKKWDTQEYCSLWGPTCDSLDCILKDTLLPPLDEGDWLYWEDMGSYTSSTACAFNGFKALNVIYTNTESSLIRKFSVSH